VLVSTAVSVSEVVSVVLLLELLVLGLVVVELVLVLVELVLVVVLAGSTTQPPL